MGDIKQARATYRSVNGLISVSWKIDEKGFSLQVAVPPNTKATIYFPKEYNKDAVHIGSGAYTYTVK